MRLEPRFTRSSACGFLICVLAVLSGCGGSGGATTGGGGGGGGNPTLSLSYAPSPVSVYPGFNFSITITARETGTTATPTVSLGTLPAGLTTTATFPMAVPAAGAQIQFAAASTMAAGSYSIPVTGSASTATASLSIPMLVASGSPSPAFFTAPLLNEVGLSQGGSPQTLQLYLSGSTLYDVSLGVTGLPSGVTATFTPQVIQPGSSFTLTLSANASTPILHNIPWTITGTPAANVAAPSLAMLLDITSPTGVGWNNQTSYVSTRATPYSAVYDSAHQLIYAANQVWNRIDVISDKTRSEVGSISIRDPRGMDLSPDGKTIWVATGSQTMYAIDTATQKSTRYVLPRFNASATSAGSSWEGAQVFSLADGTVLVLGSSYTGSGINFGGIWNPATNAFAPSSAPANWGAVARSGDGKRVFSIGSDESETSFIYDVVSGTYSAAISLSNFGYAGNAAANNDGSLVAAADYNGLTLYDGNLNPIGLLPGDGGWETFPIQNLLFGGFIFSPDGTKIYEETERSIIPFIVTIDVATRQATTLSPGMPVIPVMTQLSPEYMMPMPFGVDSGGMLLGIEYHGIAFDDATVAFNYSPNDPGSPGFLQHADVYSGPVAGGTTQGGFGNAFSLTPDVYYGQTKGTANVSSANSLTITSPPSTQPGPVDVKMLFPDGNEVYDPLFFTYGTQIQTAITSGGPPNGGIQAQLSAFGLPLDPSSDSVTVGGAAGQVLSKTTQYPPFTGEQTAMYLSYSVPPGTPGWTDITVKTPNGTGTAARSFFYGKSVTDYVVPDHATFVLFDKGRNQVYLSAGDHIDVFSLASNSFVSPLQLPAVGSAKQFEGLALTPDGKNLLATNFADNSLAVINPDSPSSAYAVSLPTGGTSFYSCSTGPLFVAADNLGKAYVVNGGIIGTACGPGGSQSIVDLNAKTSTAMQVYACSYFFGSAFVSASGDGSLIAFGGYGSIGTFQIYSPSQGTCIPSAAPAQPYGATVAADGNVVGLLRAFTDPNGNIVGRFAYPTVYYPSASSAGYYNYNPDQDGALQNPALNAAGSLYYWAYPNYIDIIDVQHGLPALRFGLTETVSNTVSPMAIDTSGQRIFLITNKGFTVVDLGNAPLAVGHLSQSAVGIGTQVTVRGSGFENGIIATVGGVSASVSVVDSETLTLTIPAAPAGIQDLVLTNPDQTTYTLQSALSVQ